MKDHGFGKQDVGSDMVEIFLAWTVGDSRAFNVVNTPNFKVFFEKAVQKV